jgi:hypothetical protein
VRRLLRAFWERVGILRAKAASADLQGRSAIGNPSGRL